MNIYEMKTLLSLKNCFTQREISQNTDLSLGQINKSLNSLREKKYIEINNQLTDLAENLISSSKPRNAIILAAGIGMRMVPINTLCPKGLLTIANEPLIERLIKQLHEKDITDITIVVGFLKEQYEYLIDKFNVKLVYNKDYSTKNNLFSLNCVKEKICNTYIIPSDIWLQKNIFSDSELYSWYSVLDFIDDDSTIKIDRFQKILKNKKQSGPKMLGISYINQSDALILQSNLYDLCSTKSNNNSFWEDALFNFNNLTIYSKTIKSSDAVEINTLEQLREIDSNSKSLKNDAIKIISEVFNCTEKDIINIQTLKKGMTNRSFLFEVNSNKYIMRIPGEGTDLLINRENEAKVYETIKDYNICDKLFYINPQTGYKITKFIENSRVCDPFSKEDVKRCMDKLRHFHELNLQVPHEFNLIDQINFYESLWPYPKSCYKDYEETKEKVLSLQEYINKQNISKCLAHIDAVSDNFLFSCNDKEIQLIDWEYSGLQDPHVDIAMFCIYSLYETKEEIDNVINLYFCNNCSDSTRVKIYCYISICGLLWSNWCEYKNQLGIEFGEYSLKQYRYAKNFFQISQNEIKKMESENA